MPDQSARRYERIDIQLRCRLFIPDAQEGKKPARFRFEAYARSRNLGLGGLFLESDFLLKPGVELSVELHLPNGPLAIWSRVAHIVGSGELEYTGMGLDFLDVDAHGRETLLRYFTPTDYEEFYKAMVGEFPHLRNNFALEDISLLVNLWEESKVKGVTPRPPAPPTEQRKRTAKR